MNSSLNQVAVTVAVNIITEMTLPSDQRISPTIVATVIHLSLCIYTRYCIARVAGEDLVR